MKLSNVISSHLSALSLVVVSLHMSFDTCHKKQYVQLLRRANCHPLIMNTITDTNMQYAFVLYYGHRFALQAWWTLFHLDRKYPKEGKYLCTFRFCKLQRKDQIWSKLALHMLLHHAIPCAGNYCVNKPRNSRVTSAYWHQRVCTLGSNHTCTVYRVREYGTVNAFSHESHFSFESDCWIGLWKHAKT